MDRRVKTNGKATERPRCDLEDLIAEIAEGRQPELFEGVPVGGEKL